MFVSGICFVSDKKDTDSDWNLLQLDDCETVGMLGDGSVGKALIMIALGSEIRAPIIHLSKGLTQQ